MKILLHADAKKRTKELKVFLISHFYWLFSRDMMAVKGLKTFLKIRTFFQTVETQTR